MKINYTATIFNKLSTKRECKGIKPNGKTSQATLGLGD